MEINVWLHVLEVMYLLVKKLENEIERMEDKNSKTQSPIINFRSGGTELELRIEQEVNLLRYKFFDISNLEEQRQFAAFLSQFNDNFFYLFVQEEIKELEKSLQEAVSERDYHQIRKQEMKKAMLEDLIVTLRLEKINPPK